LEKNDYSYNDDPKNDWKPKAYHWLYYPYDDAAKLSAASVGSQELIDALFPS